MRWVPLDRVTELVPGVSARGVKAVTLSDGVLLDHFPALPLLPGALVLEAAAQLAGLLIEVTRHVPGEQPRRALLVGADRVRFRKAAEPGDVVALHAVPDRDADGAVRARVEATIGEARAFEATLTFLLRTVDEPELHERRRALYRTWTRGLSGFTLP
ncbi:MAG: 3-hydroxyacyl-[acyl-carrier-protein] dehydratase FabZ [Alphaproteobacteria bacterium]|nr:3-hydroxyacyl-[acyl-carrier-protein] dehydratase FabZ [Alphaproteobacteria bacterium]